MFIFLKHQVVEMQTLWSTCGHLPFMNKYHRFTEIIN